MLHKGPASNGAFLHSRYFLLELFERRDLDLA